ncbi:Piwi domain-containing protein [Jimgerdemannia flammicorona]|uniref:Piwi domain-containing protein n=1 Tax=Jimgerdemannia flammicorona TaxID=994334 RepID=A0A433QL64_9FUNG|nr:Piwi domain-containing protein [Jimgerdemannia flammicorona]
MAQATSTDLTPTLPKRPTVGTLGKPITVRTNYYEIDKRPQGPLYHYDCKITDREPRALPNAKPIPVAKTRLIMMEFMEKVLKHEIRVSYDGKYNLHSYRKLPQDKLTSEDTIVYWTRPFFPILSLRPLNPQVTLNSLGGHADVYKISLELVNVIHLEAFNALNKGIRPTTSDQAGQIVTAMNILDVLIHQWPAQRYIAAGKNFYYPAGTVPMSSGLEVWRGAFQSIRMGENGKLYVNVDTAAAAFRKPKNLVDMMAEFFSMHNPNDFLRYKGLADWQTRDLNREYRGTEIEITHRGGDNRPRFKIERFTMQTAEKLKFRDDQTNKELSVANYFKQQYNAQLKYGAYLPCVVIVKKKREIFFPVELCRIVENQRYKNKLNPRATADFIKIACTKPEERERKIQELIRQIDFENNADLRAWGMHVNTKQMLTLNARVLPGPVLAYDPSSKQGQLTPREGAWNLVGQVVPFGSKLTSWAIAVFGSENEMPNIAIGRFIQELVNVCTERGMNVVNKNPKVVRGNRNEDPTVALDKAYSFASFRDPATNIPVVPQLIMCILNDKAKQSRLYDPVKKWGDCKQGIVTQCVTYYPHVPRAQNQYCNNLFLKINAKLGGMNIKLAPKMLGRWNEVPCIIVGCDVTHAPIGSTSPSVATLVASMDSSFARYAAEIRAQPLRREIIEDFGGMLKALLNMFYLRNNKAQPQRILVYRDGVSEGMFEAVKKYEIDAIKRTCAELSVNFKPLVTYVAVQKRHHTRFFPMDQNRDRSGNCVPGTVVDTGVTHPYEFDFFLQSHAGIQGTSRPTHYQVLHDEFQFKSDELQLLTYRLCYTYGRCTRAVSVVPPVFYADQCGYRVRTHLKDANKWSGDESKRTDDSGEDPASLFETLSVNIKGSYKLFYKLLLIRDKSIFQASKITSYS